MRLESFFFFARDGLMLMRIKPGCGFYFEDTGTCMKAALKTAGPNQSILIPAHHISAFCHVPLASHPDKQD